MRDIPAHIAADPGTAKRPNPAHFPEFWRVEVLLNGVRQAYVTEAMSGPAGWIVQLQRDDRGGFLRDEKNKPKVGKLSGLVEFRWREGAGV